MTDIKGEVSRLAELIEGIRFGMFTTIDDLGKMVARPMTLQQTEPNSNLWFLASRDSTAIAQLAINPSCGVTLPRATRGSRSRVPARWSMIPRRSGRSERGSHQVF
jgi:general stress protein 26